MNNEGRIGQLKIHISYPRLSQVLMPKFDQS